MSKIPRRMQRFYRQPKQNKDTYSQDTYSQDTYSQDNYSQKNDSFSNKTNGLPSMDYEDINIDEKNYQELKKIEKLNLEEKLALLEVKKFQQEKKRLPNKKETETMADNLFTQFKENNEISQAPGHSRPERNKSQEHSRRDRHGSNQKQIPQEELSIPQNDTPNANIKDLFSDTSIKENEKKGDDFDLGLDLDSDTPANINENLDDFDDLKSFPENKKKCSNCGKEHEKTIFCSKCGTAFCEKCAKGLDAEGYICPKCGVKSKA
jgi:hypothetical protein